MLYIRKTIAKEDLIEKSYMHTSSISFFRRISIRTYFFLCILILLSDNANSQNHGSYFKGFVVDRLSGEKLIGATVYFPNTKKATVTNGFGYFSQKITKTDTISQINYVGYYAEIVNLKSLVDSIFIIRLINSTKLDSIIIIASKPEFQRTQAGLNILTPMKINSIPYIFGEKDVIKALQFLPGVQPGIEGTTGINVRGGSADQNLIILDDVQVFNVNHLFGIFSIFNTSSIKSVNFYKSGFPANYGGRASSVIDVRLKDGDYYKCRGEVSLGLISSNLLLEGPILKEKSSYIITLRRTYADLLLRPFMGSILSTGQKTKAGFYFYDFTGKVNATLNNNNRIYLSLYGGADPFFYKTINKDPLNGREMNWNLKWGNQTSSFRWNHLFNNSSFLNTTIFYTNYSLKNSNKETYKITDGEGNTKRVDFITKYNTGLSSVGLKADFQKTLKWNNIIRLGLNQSIYFFKPSYELSFLKDALNLESIDTSSLIQDIRTIESCLYVSDEIVIGKRFSADVGLRGMIYRSDSIFYSLEPRVNIRFIMAEYISAKYSYARGQQIIHMLTNNNINLPTDLLLPPVMNREPEEYSIHSVGISGTFKKIFSFSIESYTKQLSNLISYLPSNLYMGSNNWIEKTEKGKGESRGIELMIEKMEGKFTGWMSYTLSKTTRQFPHLNNGKEFYFGYDRRHMLSIVGSYHFNNKFELSGNWIFASGNYTTLTSEGYFTIIGDFSSYEQLVFNSYYEGFNNYKLPNYHRLDLGFTINGENRYGTTKWIFGVYNVYSRKNPFYITRRDDKFIQISMLPFLPSINYSINF